MLLPEATVRETEILEREAALFASYLGVPRLNPELAHRYARALRTRNVPVTSRDRRILRFVAARPALLPFVDGGLALRYPTSELRRRLFVMAAILEATPDHAERFLPVGRSPLYVAFAAVAAVRAAFRGAIGTVLIGWI